MKVKLNHALSLGKKDYSKGVHELPEEALKDEHFKRWVEVGYLEPLEVKKVEAKEEQPQPQEEKPKKKKKE